MKRPFFRLCSVVVCLASIAPGGSLARAERRGSPDGTGNASAGAARSSAPAIGCPSLAAALQPILDDGVRRGLPGVALAVYSPQCGLLELSSGHSVVSTSTAMQPRALFRIASCSKTFLGVVVMQLVAEGAVSLSDRIAKYIPADDAANIANARTATVRQLMNHTSGIYDYFGDAFLAESEAHPGKVYTPEEALKFAYGEQPAFTPPGSGYEYSNTDAVLLAVMVERVTHAPFTKALRQRIFGPLGLSRTSNDYAEPVTGPLAHGYLVGGRGKLTDYTTINQGYGLPDGGIVSDAGDMVTFMRALLHEGKLLDQATLDTMRTVDPAASEAQQGLNIFVYSDYLDGVAGPLVGHSGEITGYKSEMFYFPKRDIAIVMLTNGSGKKIDQLWDPLFDDVARQVLAAAGGARSRQVRSSRDRRSVQEISES